MRRRRIALIGLITVLAGVGAGTTWLLSNSHGAHTGPTMDPSNAGQVALGAQVYAARCAACHGTALEGQPNWRERKPDGRLPAPPHDASGHTWHHPDAHLFRITKLGVAALVPGYESDMPGFADVLSDAEIAAAIAYIKSTWPAEIQERQARRSAQAESSD